MNLTFGWGFLVSNVWNSMSQIKTFEEIHEDLIDHVHSYLKKEQELGNFNEAIQVAVEALSAYTAAAIVANKIDFKNLRVHDTSPTGRFCRTLADHFEGYYNA